MNYKLVAAALLTMAVTTSATAGEFVYRYRGTLPEIASGNPTTPGGGTTQPPDGGNQPVLPVSFGGGANFTCALDTGGGASCWGTDSLDPFVDGKSYPERLSNSPVRVIGLQHGVRKVDASGDDYACFVMTSGSVSCLGHADSAGMLGDGSREWFEHLNTTPPIDVLKTTGNPEAPAPRPVPGIAGATDISTHNTKACVVVSGGGVTCWGQDSLGLPAAVPGVSGVTKVFVGYTATCGIFSSGTAGCWGFLNGSLGDGTTTRSSSPVMIQGLDGRVIDMAVGLGAACAVTDAGHVWCWGLAQYGFLGNGPIVNNEWEVAVPRRIAGLEGVKEVSGNDSTACAIAGDGVWCWGDGSSYQLGNGVKATSFDPVKVPGLTASASGLMTVDDRSCLVQGGEGWCWGWNNHGKLGSGVPMLTMPYSILPVKVAWPF